MKPILVHVDNDNITDFNSSERKDDGMWKYPVLAGCIIFTASCNSTVNEAGVGTAAPPTGDTLQGTKTSSSNVQSPFAGKWCGYWRTSEPVELVVSNVTDTGKAKVEFQPHAWKNVRGKSGNQENSLGWPPKEFEGKIVNGELKFADEFRNAKVNYRIREDGSLVGIWSRDDGNRTVESKRCGKWANQDTEISATTDYRAFLGNWCGKWQQRPIDAPRKTLISVLDITPDGFATLIYTAKGRRMTFSKLVKGVVTGGNLRFTVFEEPLHFWIDSSRLSGSWLEAVGPNRIDMDRCNDQEMATYVTDYDRTFLGHWCGNWDNGSLFGRVVISWLDTRGRAGGIYMTKHSSYATRSDEIRGRVSEDNKLNFTLKNDAKVQYWLEDNGRLAGTYKRPGAEGVIAATPCSYDVEFGVLN